MRRPAATPALLPVSLIALLLLLIVPLSVHASPALHVRDDMHMHHGQPMAEINETQILQWHLPTPPSYWSVDIDEPDPNITRYPALIALHALFMSLAFFVALPAGMLLLRTHPVHPHPACSSNCTPLGKACLPWPGHGLILCLFSPRLCYQQSLQETHARYVSGSCRNPLPHSPSPS